MSSKIAKYTIKCRKTLETLPDVCYNINNDKFLKYTIHNKILKSH